MNCSLSFARKTWAVLSTATVFTAAGVCATSAQENLPLPLDHIRSLQLDSLGGEVWVYHSAGHRERAEYLQELLAGAKLFFQRPDIIDADMNIGLVVLGQEDWTEVIQMPYGMAHISNDPPAAILAATHDNWLTNNNLARKEQLPEVFLQRFDDLDLEFEESARTLTDLIGFHEMGHLFAFSYGIDTWPADKWLAEFVATYLAYSFMKEERPHLAAIWDIMMDASVEAGSVQYTTLADFEELYVRTGPDYGWYQGRFGQRVAEVYEQMGISFMHALKESLEENPEHADDDPYRLKQLENICEGFLTWAPDNDLGGGDSRQ